MRLNRKTPAHFVNQGLWGSVSRPQVCKRLRVCGQRSCAGVDAKRRRLLQQAEVLLLFQDRMGFG